MSAICGLFHRTGAPIESEHLTPMITALDAYGPDGQHTWQQDSVSFGHCMLHVTPESLHETLPYTDSASGLTITADARLDNREELCAALSIPHTERAQITDSQLILRAYQKWAADCPLQLLGDFAFAIWNAHERTLFCARDHIGARPLYYSLTPQRCVFASDMRTMLACPEVSNQLNEPYVAARLLDKFFAHPHQTFYEAIRSLAPGHTLTVGSERDELARYWFLEHVTEDDYASDAERQDAFLALYTQAVQTRLRTPYHVGSHLSGGLDSSSVTALTARILRQQGRPAPSVFCWQPPPQGEGPLGWEHTLVQAVCDQEGLTPTYQTLTVDDMISLLQRDLTLDPGMLHLDHELTVQQQAVGQGVRVLLSGTGGDEGITGHGEEYYPELLRRGQWRQLFAERRAAGMNWKGLARAALLPFCPAQVQDLVHRWQADRPLRRAPSYIHPNFARRVQPLSQKPWRMTDVHQVQIQRLTSGHLTQRLDSWAAAGARHHIVYSYPLLDRRVLEFALGMPIEQYRHGPWGRWFMRQALAHILPKDVCWHRDKRDPERGQHLKMVRSQALLAVGQSLASGRSLSSRASYIVVTSFFPPGFPRG